MFKKLFLLLPLCAPLLAMESVLPETIRARRIQNNWSKNAYLIFPTAETIYPLEKAIMIPGKSDSPNIKLPIKNGAPIKISTPAGTFSTAAAHHNMELWIGYDKVTIS